jgi:hypothetical protein
MKHKRNVLYAACAAVAAGLDKVLYKYAAKTGLLCELAPTGTFQSYQAIGNREDLSDMIYNISPANTPLQSLIGRETVDNALTEWQTDTLAAVDAANAVIEGDDATIDVVGPTTRVSNLVQTSDKVASVSTIQNTAIKKAGRKGTEMAYQMVKRGKELKRDMETILLSNQAPVVGTASTARKLRPLLSWYASSVSAGALGTNGSSTTARTDSASPRNFSEILLKTAMQLAYVAGGEPRVLMVGPVNRVNCSSQLSGGATKFYRTEDKKLIATIAVYETDYGPLKIVPNRFQRDRDAHLLDPEFLAMGYLESPQSQDLAVTGLTRKKQLWTSYTLIVKNEGAHALIADLNTAIL